jgi:hypothetical protein
MEQPIARVPQFRSFSPNVLPQTAKNIVVELGVHGLTLGGKFMLHSPSNVKKHDEELVSKHFETPLCENCNIAIHLPRKEMYT